MYGRGKKLSKRNETKKKFYIRREQNNIKDRIIGDIWTLVATEKENKERKKIEKKKELYEILIEDWIIRNIRTLFDQQEEDEDWVNNNWGNNNWSSKFWYMENLINNYN